MAEYSTIVASQQDAKVNYLTDDTLGSPGVNTDQNVAVIARHDYQPFGEELTSDQSSQRIDGLDYGSDDVRGALVAHHPRDTRYANETSSGKKTS